jgi:hypothetical protein
MHRQARTAWNIPFRRRLRVELVSALLDAGVTKSLMERAAVSRWLNLDHVDAYLPREPSPRSDRTFADFVSFAGTVASVLPVVYEVMGLPQGDGPPCSSPT